MRPGAGHHNEVSSREDWVMVSERRERGAAGVLGLALSADPAVCLVLLVLYHSGNTMGDFRTRTYAWV